MNPTNKARVSSHWYVYAIVSVSWVLLWAFVNNIFIADKKEETVKVFLACPSFETSKVQAALDASKDSFIKHVRITGSTLDDNLFYSRFETSGLASDLLVIPKSMSSSYYCERYFASVDAEIATKYGFALNDGYAAEDNLTYGIKITGDGTKNGIVFQKGETTEPYYVFFNKTSVQVGSLNGSTLSGAITIAKAIISI